MNGASMPPNPMALLLEVRNQDEDDAAPEDPSHKVPPDMLTYCRAEYAGLLMLA